MADVEDAKEFLRQANDAESQMRQLGLKDLRFRYGDQWPSYAIASRGLERPKLTINEMDSYIRQVTNNQRQQRPRIKVSPVDNYADPKIAKVITGLIRHIQVNSDADNAYDTAFDFAATMGWGYWRIRTDYIAQDSFDQDVFIDVIENPFTVYFDPSSRLPDGSDSEQALITDLIKRDVFKKLYPGAQESGFENRGTGDDDPDWSTEHEIRVAEYFYVDRQKQKLIALSDGSIFWEDKLPPPELMMKVGVSVVGDRDSYRRTVQWCKQTGAEILEKRTLPGRFIPVVPVYWTRVRMDSNWDVRGIVRDATDPQIMLNFWNTAFTEAVALTPKAKWLMADGQDEGHEKEFAEANLSPNPVLRYKQTDVEGRPAPPPTYIPPPQPPAAIIAGMEIATQNLQKVVGIFDPAVRSVEPKSGKAILAERQQSEMSVFHGYDNLVRSIKHTGRVILDYIPVVYDKQRVARIIGEDRREELVTLNEPKQKQDDMGNAIDTVLNDVRVGTYDVVMETGPGYDTKRQEGQAAMLELMRTPVGEAVAQVGSDIFVRQMDFNESDVLADRLAAANPLAQIDEKLDIPPKVQMMLGQQKKMIQELGQKLQNAELQLKYRGDVEQMRQQGETQRTLIKETGNAHKVEQENLSLQHSVEVKAVTEQNKAEIQAFATLLSKHMDVSQLHALKKEIEGLNAEQTMKANESAASQPA